MHVQRLIVKDCTAEEAVQLAHPLRLHPSLQELGIKDTPLDTPAVLGALVDAAIGHGLTGFFCSECELGPLAATHLARLLRDAPRLSALLLHIDSLCEAASAPVLASALRVSSLSVLSLESVRLWHNGMGSTMIDALVGHRTLQQILLSYNWVFSITLSLALLVLAWLV